LCNIHYKNTLLMINKNNFFSKWFIILILIIGILSIFTIYSYFDLSYIISFLRNNIKEIFNTEIGIELLVSMFEEFINIVGGIIFIIFNSFFKKNI